MADYFKSIPCLTVVLTGLSYLFPLVSVQAKDYDCGQADGCLSFMLSSSEQCLGVQYNRLENTAGRNENIVILSAHGSRVEQVTSPMSSPVAEFDSWNQYDFSDHGSASRAYLLCG